MNKTTAQLMLSVRDVEEDDDALTLFEQLNSGIRRGELTYAYAALLANISQLEICDAGRVCSLIAFAMGMPIKSMHVADNEAMEDERLVASAHNLQIYEAPCIAASNAIKQREIGREEVRDKVWQTVWTYGG